MKYLEIIKFTLFLAIVLLLAACTSPYIGKQFPNLNFNRININNNISGSVGEILLDYNTSVDPIRKKINLSGTIQINSTEFTGAWEVDEIKLFFFILNKEKTIVSKKTIFVRASGHFADEKIPFSGSFELKDEYVYVTHGYSGRVLM